MIRSASRPIQANEQKTGDASNTHSKSRSKIMNQAEKKKLEEEQEARKKK